MSMTDYVTLERYRAKVKQCEEYQIRDRMLSQELTKLREENEKLKSQVEMLSTPHTDALFDVMQADATQMFAALVESGSSNRLPDDLIERWRKK